MTPLQSITQSAMQSDMAQLTRISTNLANTLTPAYKRQMVSVSQGGDFQHAVARAARDMQAGTQQRTGRALDVALGGAGFFEVSSPTGPMFTRLGQFQLDPQGRLVTLQGDPVMGNRGDITLETAAVDIAADGTILQNGRPVDQLRIVDPEDASALIAVNDGQYSAAPNAALKNATTPDLRQGFLENSNVQPLHEMMQLMQTVRHFESMQRVAQGMDDMLGMAIRKLGDL
jgi:flagellar basal-body rod protein FlgG